jgi:hypothetical protein
MEIAAEIENIPSRLGNLPPFAIPVEDFGQR